MKSLRKFYAVIILALLMLSACSSNKPSGSSDSMHAGYRFAGVCGDYIILKSDEQNKVRSVSRFSVSEYNEYSVKRGRILTYGNYMLVNWCLEEYEHFDIYSVKNGKIEYMASQSVEAKYYYEGVDCLGNVWYYDGYDTLITIEIGSNYMNIMKPSDITGCSSEYMFFAWPYQEMIVAVSETHIKAVNVFFPERKYENSKWRDPMGFARPTVGPYLYVRSTDCMLVLNEKLQIIMVINCNDIKSVMMMNWHICHDSILLIDAVGSNQLWDISGGVMRIYEKKYGNMHYQVGRYENCVIYEDDNGDVIELDVKYNKKVLITLNQKR